MTKSSYRQALDEAVEEQRDLTKQRADIDQRIARLRETIVTLLRLLAEKGEPIDVTQIFEDEEMPDDAKTSITEAISDLLKAREGSMTASQIMTGLTGIGFDVERFSAPLQTITTTLSRLAQGGEVIQNSINGVNVYAWNRSSFKHSPLKYLGQRSKGLKGLREAKEQPSWWKHLLDEAVKQEQEEGGLKLTNPPYGPDGKKLTPRQRRLAAEAERAQRVINTITKPIEEITKRKK
jgi:hypothetical protein